MAGAWRCGSQKKEYEGLDLKKTLATPGTIYE